MWVAVGLQLTLCWMFVKKHTKKGVSDPFISTPGVKMGLNRVNMWFLTPSFPLQSQTGQFSINHTHQRVNNTNHPEPPRQSMLTNQFINKF